MKGRKATPTVLKILRGNPGKRAINQDEPVPDSLSVETPDELTDPQMPKDRRELAVQEWTRTIVPLIRIGQITSAERVMAIAHCVLWATWKDQLSEAWKHAHIIAVGPNNYPTPNPLQGMANKTFLLLAKTDEMLGLTPTSRSRVQAKKGGRARPMSAVEKFKAEKHRRA